MNHCQSTKGLKISGFLPGILNSDFKIEYPRKWCFHKYIMMKLLKTGYEDELNQ